MIFKRIIFKKVINQPKMFIDKHIINILEIINTT